MQQLTSKMLSDALAVSADGQLLIQLPLPTSPEAFSRLCEQLADLFGQPCAHQAWGADRAQAWFTLPDMDLLLQAEWMCEAMWITPSGYAAQYTNACQASRALLSRVASH